MIALFDNETENLVNELHLELGISKKDIREIIECPFKLFSNMAELYSPDNLNAKRSIKILSLGTFYLRNKYEKDEDKRRYR